MIKITIVGVDRDAEALAAQHEPDDSQLPVLEPVYVRVRMFVKIQQRPSCDQRFAASISSGKQERNVRHLFRQHIDGAIDPYHLLVGVGEDRASGLALFAPQPGGGVKGPGVKCRVSSVRTGNGNVETEEFHMS